MLFEEAVLAQEGNTGERGSFGIKKRLCVNCAGSFDALKMKKAGGKHYCLECYADLVETSKRRPPVAAAVPEEVSAQVRAAEAARRDPSLLAEADGLERALSGGPPGDAPTASPDGSRPPTPTGVQLGPQGLARKMALAEEVATHARREFWIDAGLLVLKLVLYGGFITAAAVAGGPARFALVGFFGADFFVWVFVSALLLPVSSPSFVFEFVVYLGLILFFASGTDLVATPTTNDEMAVVFITFLFTFFAKGGYHSLKLLNEFTEG